MDATHVNLIGGAVASTVKFLGDSYANCGFYPYDMPVSREEALKCFGQVPHIKGRLSDVFGSLAFRP